MKPGDVIEDISMYDNSHSRLPRILETESSRKLMMHLHNFNKLLQEREITFIMAQGMLLGSFMFHGLIPWDDDIDIFIDIKDLNKLRAMMRDPEIRTVYDFSSFHDPVNVYSHKMILEDIPTDNTYSCGQSNPGLICHQQGKIFRKTDPHPGKAEWRYPDVDFAFFATNSTHMYNHELWSRDGRIELPLADFYPLHLRPYQHLWLPAPRKPVLFLTAKYGVFRCAYSRLSHKDERFVFHLFMPPIECHVLLGCYKHVRRRPLTALEVAPGPSDEWSVEEIILDGRVMQSAFVKESFVAKYLFSFSSNAEPENRNYYIDWAL